MWDAQEHLWGGTGRCDHDETSEFLFGRENCDAIFAAIGFAATSVKIFPSQIPPVDPGELEAFDKSVQTAKGCRMGSTRIRAWRNPEGILSRTEWNRGRVEGMRACPGLWTNRRRIGRLVAQPV